MPNAASDSGKLFSVDLANRMLPLVRAIVTDLVNLSQEVAERRKHLNQLMLGRELEAGDIYDAELAEVERSVQRDSHRLREFVEELRQLGVEAKGHDGAVDFPTMLEGRRAFLCWKLGEPEVSYWHELDAGFAGRKPLAVPVHSGGDGSLAS